MRATDHSTPIEKSNKPKNVGNDRIIDKSAGKKVLSLILSGSSLNRIINVKAVIPKVREKVKSGLIIKLIGFINRNL
jgi:hypothetical protein